MSAIVLRFYTDSADGQFEAKCANPQNWTSCPGITSGLPVTRQQFGDPSVIFELRDKGRYLPTLAENWLGHGPKLLLSVGPEWLHSIPYRSDSVGGLEEPSQDRSMD
jgi:hypothetical protein